MDRPSWQGTFAERDVRAWAEAALRDESEHLRTATSELLLAMAELRVARDALFEAGGDRPAFLDPPGAPAVGEG